MTRGLIGRKIGMSHVYADNGDVIPVTVLEVGPCSVSQVKTPEKDGYLSIQLAFGDVKESALSKPENIHLEKYGIAHKRHLKEFKVDGVAPAIGSTINILDVFKELDTVKVSGITKGKGFQGVVKRHGFSGVGESTHGQHNRLRAPGSIGACSFPARVFKGTRMAGRTGGSRVKSQNLAILKVDTEKNLVVVKGSIPGHNGSTVLIEK
jgi:large subunit ribosomal protein L3